MEVHFNSRAAKSGFSVVFSVSQHETDGSNLLALHHVEVSGHFYFWRFVTPAPNSNSCLSISLHIIRV